ncbi:sensor histidine kinase [Sporosarcina sp. FSL K6-1522]|uniref:sensor histidine kinase n=1 Tax=Sporosarcina sp. FSL K6-1522 TaxID=2921554 RepID=UPI00315A4FFD
MNHFRKSDSKHLQRKPNVMFNLKMKMILLIGILIIAIVTIIGLFIDQLMSEALETQVGERALSVAESIARIPEVAKAFEHEDPASIINPIVTPIREAAGAEFIVVGNREEIRYAHPSEEQIGKKMIGEDNERALRHGDSYVSKAVGSLGSSLRAKVPVYLEGQIVGVVSVGFLADNIQDVVKSYNHQLWFVLVIIAIVAIIGAIFIASYIKRVLFGLEPEEIAHLLFQKETILQSTHEGIIAVNQNGVVTMINAAAEHLLSDQTIHPQQYLGKRMNELSLAYQLSEYLEEDDSQVDKEMMIGKTTVFVNKVPLAVEGMLMGTVFTLRNKTEIDLLTKELARVQQYANALRAQTHEFTNKLYLILGLLQLNQKEQAIDYIQKESTLQKNWIHLLIRKVADPLVSGLLLGKLNQAHELGIDLVIQEESVLTTCLSDKQSEALLTAMGNLIDNAMDAVKSNCSSNQKIILFFTDMGHEILFEIEDSGEGIPEVYIDRLFEQGFTSKEGTHRGFGLALTQQLITEVGGALYFEEGELGGASFVISIPKEPQEREEDYV